MNIKCIFGHKEVYKNLRNKPSLGFFGWFGDIYSDEASPRKVVCDASCARCGLVFNREITIPGYMVSYFNKETDHRLEAQKKLLAETKKKSKK